VAGKVLIFRKFEFQHFENAVFEKQNLYHYPLAQFTLQHLAHFTPLLPFLEKLFI